MATFGEELERLARLKSSGDITEAEYKMLKVRLIGGVSGEEPPPPAVDQDPLDPHICAHCGWVAPDGTTEANQLGRIAEGWGRHNLFLSNCPQCGRKHPLGGSSGIAVSPKVVVQNKPMRQTPRVAGEPLAQTPMRPSTPQGGGGLATAGLVCGLVAFLFLPIILGPIGIVLGAIAWGQGHPRGRAATIVSIVGTVVGMWFGMVMWSY